MVWRQGMLAWVVVIATGALLAAVFWQGIVSLMGKWGREEYSHGYLIPFVVLFLIWQKRGILERMEFRGSWAGVLVAGVGLLVLIAGELSTLYVVVQYGFFIALVGVVLAWLGGRAFAVISIPLLMLVFTIPLPNFLYNNLSSSLQLLSSEIGTRLIRSFGISVYLAGNVIDLGSMKLQVVEACSGLRYLFPFMTLAFVVAYLYKAAWWKRALVFLSSVPITIAMNSARIGLVGVTVELWGEDMARGFLHDFEGWAMFMACLALLFLLMWGLTHLPPENRPWRELFGVTLPAPTPAVADVKRRGVQMSLVACLILLFAAAIASHALPTRHEVVPNRHSFASFPTVLGEWRGQRRRLEEAYINALRLDDFLLADFVNGVRRRVHLYAAYYQSQRKGASVHSPRSCIPGGGWRFESFVRRPIEGVEVMGSSLKVNRVEIAQGNRRLLVYYWFQQRGRLLTNEYAVKWYLFWDALTRRRTDGALVRLMIEIPPGEHGEDVEGYLQEFAAEIAGELGKYIPV